MGAAICPNGHLSDTGDYCDQCGAKIGGDPAAPAAMPAPGSAASPAPPAEGAGQAGPTASRPCPACGAANAETDKFCEVCGYDMTLGAPGAVAGPTPGAPAGEAPAGESLYEASTASTPVSPFSSPAQSAEPALAPATWQAVVTADRDYYERMQAADIAFPPVYPDRVFTLSTPRAVIGRRSASRGINPEIDLSGAPEDPGVSHMHAVLVGNAEGGWTIIDPGSSNGTFMNENTDPIANNQAVPLADGDRIHMGAWTTLTLRRA